MPVALSYPGVYVEELPSGVHTITGVATSITAFIGRALSGPSDQAVRIQSFADYERQYGGLWSASPMSYAVQQFFAHGGSDAYIVRVNNGAKAATITLAGDGELVLVAAGEGAWGNALRASVSYTATKDPATLYTVVVQQVDTSTPPQVLRSETFVNLSSDPANARYVKTVLDQDSALVSVKTAPAAGKRPKETVTKPADPNNADNFIKSDGAGSDGDAITDVQIQGDQATRKGIYALDPVDLFNILCIPPLDWDSEDRKSVV